VPVADLTPRGPVIDQGTPVPVVRDVPASAPAPIVTPVLPAVEPMVDVTPVPAAAVAPAPLMPEPVLKPNGPLDLIQVRPPDDPGPAAPEPGADPVPKPSAEFSRGVVK
jgi:hypothetical protein